MTPIASVSHELSNGFLTGLPGNECNIFALDFPGVGHSSGENKDLNYETMVESVINLIDYIRENYSSNIHFYGGTGTGGIFGQALVSDNRIAGSIRSFAQFGAAVYRDCSPIADTRKMKIAYPLIRTASRIAPNLRLPFSVPRYEGLNAIQENQWYQEIMDRYPGIFDLAIPLVSTLLFIMLDSHSPLRTTQKCPTLVIAAEEDRYFSKDYIERYFDRISGEKDIHWVKSSHLAFLWNAEEINRKVIDWVQKH
ncbi:alpha/beta hydrolase [Spirochaeta dissipatitropha]